MNTYDLKPKPENQIENAVIFLHGYGSNGQDLLGIGHQWQDPLPHTYFISADAPFPYEEAPFGHQWFSLRDRTLEAMAKGAQEARPHVETLIEKVSAQFSLPRHKIALVGFSQGTMMSLSTALNHRDGLGCVVGYSGVYLPEPAPILSKPDILLIHGALDDVLPLDYHHLSKETLEKFGLNVTTYIRQDLGHGVDDWGLKTGHQFLKDKIY